MNKRLTQLLQTAAQTYRGGAAYLDCYNQALYTDIAPTITTRVYESNMYYLMEEIKDPIIIANPHGYYEGGEYPETSPAVRSSAFQANTAVAEPQITNPNNPAPTLTGANHAKVWQSIEEIIEQAKTAHPSRGIIMIKNTPCWVRRLTERELFRLMDVEEPDIDTLLNAGISNTQLAKLAGNSIVTACMYHIFKNLFIETTPPPNTQTQLF